MKRTNTNDYKRAVYAYLIDCMNDNEAADMTPAQKVAWIAQRVRSEMSHVVTRQGLQAACTEWLQGLGMAIDYTYSDTVKVAERLHGCTFTDKERESIEQGFFAHMGYKLAELIRYTEAGKVDLLPEQVTA